MTNATQTATGRTPPKVAAPRSDETGGVPAVQNGGVPAIILDDEDVGGGLDDVSLSGITPFLRILETNSKQVKPARPEYVPGAQPGMLINTATSKFYSGETGVSFVAAYIEHHYGEWTPVDDGGGFHGVKHEDDEEVRALLRKHGKFQALPTGRGTEYVEAYQVYLLYSEQELNPDMGLESLLPAITSYSSTKIPVFNKWYQSARSIQYQNGRGALVRPSLWQHRYRLTTIPVSRGNQDWFNFVIRFAEGEAASSFVPGSSPLAKAAKEFREMIMAGGVKADYGQGEGRHPGEDEEMPGV